MTERQAQIIEAACDWYTAIAEAGHAAEELSGLASRLLQSESIAGESPTAFACYGYEGDHAGAVSVGYRGDRVLLQVSGSSAHASLARALGTGARFTRLDLQVTARVIPEDLELAARWYETPHSEPRGRGKPAVRSLFVNDQGGATLYVGKGSSESMGRIYNKAVESADPAYTYCWRWEVQYRREQAVLAASALRMTGVTAEQIAGMVMVWFYSRGIDTEFDASDPMLSVPAPRTLSTLDRKLEWLRKSVRPTVEILVDRGLRPATMIALGLSTAIDPISASELDTEFASLYHSASRGASTTDTQEQDDDPAE